MYNKHPNQNKTLIVFFMIMLMYHTVVLAAITAVLLDVILIGMLGGVFRGDVISP